MNPNSSGVSIRPNRLDAVAAQTAPATLPWAIEVSAIDDCTVDGRADRKSRPMINVRFSAWRNTPVNTAPMIGNSTNVVLAMVLCSRQLVMPATTASRDNRAPCRKNNDAMAKIPSAWKQLAAAPWQGSRDARATVAARATTKRSMFSRTRPRPMYATSGICGSPRNAGGILAVARDDLAGGDQDRKSVV